MPNCMVIFSFLKGEFISLDKIRLPQLVCVAFWELKSEYLRSLCFSLKHQMCFVVWISSSCSLHFLTFSLIFYRCFSVQCTELWQFSLSWCCRDVAFSIYSILFHLHLILPPHPPPSPVFPILLLLVFSQKDGQENSFQQDQVPEQLGLLHYFRGTDAQRGRW